MAGQEPKGSLIEGVFGESVSVKEGEPITLPTGLTQIPKNVAMDWTFGPNQILIARVRKENNPTIYNDVLNGKFSGRLELDGQTGNLTILNTRSSDSGDYKVYNSINTFIKSISVSVIASTSDSGLSSGAIAGIVIGVIAAVAAAVGGIGYGYWKKGQML